MGRALSNLRKDRDFIKVIDELYIKQGKEALWENIRHFEELNLKSFDEGRAKAIKSLKKEVQARLVFEQFLALIESDGEIAQEDIEFLNKKED